MEIYKEKTRHVPHYASFDNNNKNNTDKRLNKSEEIDCMYVHSSTETHTNSTRSSTTEEEPLLKRSEECEQGSIHALPQGHVTPYRAVFMISNAALGAGLVNFPEAYMKVGGIHVAIGIQTSLLLFIAGAFVILARCATKYQAGTYQDIVLFVLGKKFRNFIRCCIVLYFCGTCITYVIIIGEQLSSLMELATGHTNMWYTDRRTLSIIFSLLCLLPLCIPRRLRALSYTSCFGGVGAILITCVIVHNYFIERYKPHPKVSAQATNNNWRHAFAALPVICFGFQCHVSSVVVYSEMKNRSVAKFFACALTSLVICNVTYCICGSFGYLTFGAKTRPDILTNYDVTDTLINIARVSILLILLSSFSIQAFCARTVIDDVIVRMCSYSSFRKEETEQARRVTITVVWFSLVLILGSLVPNISVAIAMVSGVAALYIFVFPGLCLMMSVNMWQSFVPTKDKLTLVVSVLYVGIGTFIFGLVTTLAAQQVIKLRHLA